MNWIDRLTAILIQLQLKRIILKFLCVSVSIIIPPLPIYAYNIINIFYNNDKAALADTGIKIHDDKDVGFYESEADAA